MGGVRLGGVAVAPATIGVPYSKFVGGATTIWHVPFAGGTPEQITPPVVGEDHETPVVDPITRMRVAYIVDFNELWICNKDGTGAAMIDTDHHRALDWHPDGSVIAFTTFNTGEGNAIVTIEPDGSNRQILYATANPDDFLNAPVYSHDGTRIAFCRNVETPGTGPEYGELWVIDADGSNAVKLDDTLDGYQMEYTPGWSNDDTMIAFGDGGNSANNDIPNHAGVACGSWYVIPSDGSGSRTFVGSQITEGTDGGRSSAEAESSRKMWLPDDSGIVVPTWEGLGGGPRWALKICQADGSGEAYMSPIFRVFDRPVFCFPENGRIYAVAYEEPVFTSITFDSVLPDGSDRRVEDPSGFNILLEYFE